MPYYISGYQISEWVIIWQKFVGPSTSQRGQKLPVHPIDLKIVAKWPGWTNLNLEVWSTPLVIMKFELFASNRCHMVLTKLLNLLFKSSNRNGRKLILKSLHHHLPNNIDSLSFPSSKIRVASSSKKKLEIVLQYFTVDTEVILTKLSLILRRIMFPRLFSEFCT